MQRVFLAIVPVTHFVEIEETDIVSSDFADLFTMLVDLTPNVVLLLEHVSTVLNYSGYIVLLVMEGLLGDYLVAKCTHEETINLVFWLVQSNAATIFECDIALSNIFNLGGLNSCSNHPLHGPIQGVILVLN